MRAGATVVVSVLLLAQATRAQAPAAAGTFARAYLNVVAPAVDDPDAIARDALTALADCRSAGYAARLVGLLAGERERLQRPAELLPAVDALLAADDLHGLLLSQLRWYRYHLLLAAARPADAARVDPCAGLPRSYLCVGPFGGAADHFLGVAFAPELQPWADAAVFASEQGPRRARVAALGIAVSAPDPADPAEPRDGCYYALHRVEAANETQCYLALWSRGALEVFVNGTAVAALDPIDDGCNDHTVPVALAAGVNHVLVKTCTRDQRTFELRYVDARWRPQPGLRDVPAGAPLAPMPAAIAAALPPFPSPEQELRSALAAATAAQRIDLQLALGLTSEQFGPREEPLLQITDLVPTDPQRQLAAAVLWRRIDPVPEEIRNARARALEEAAARQLDDSCWAMLRATVGLLEEGDRREEALDRLWRAVDAGRAGPATFRLLAGVADRAKFAPERRPLLDRWRQALPNDPEPRIALARDWYRAGATAEAAAIGAEAIRLRPDLLDNLGAAWRPAIDRGDVATASELCRLAMPPELYTADAGLQPLLWQVANAQRDADPDRFAELLGQVVAHPQANAGRLRHAADQLLQRGLVAPAIAAYAAALQRAPDELRVRRTLCRLRGEPEPGSDFARFRRDGDAAIAAFTAGEREASAPATTLIDQRIVEVFADGSRLTEVHELRRLNDPSAVEQYGDASAPARADEVLLLRTIAPDGQEFVPVRIKEGYTMPRLEPGAFVEWRYRDFESAPADGALAVPEFLFASANEHLLLSELVVIQPQGAALELRSRNFAGDPERVDLGDGREARRYTVHDSLRLQQENAMPAFADLVPVVAGGRDGEAAAALRQHRHNVLAAAQPTPPIRAEVAALLEGVTDPTAQLRALHAFCQRDITPAQSRSATETLMRKKGNPTDLLLAMLRTADFELEPALCESIRQELITGEGALFYDPEAFFDDRCVRVQKPGLAPTWVFYGTPRHYPAGAVPPQRARGGALVWTDAGIEATSLPGSDEHQQHLEVQATGTLQRDGIEIEATVTMRGDEGFRAAEYFLRQPANTRRQFARQFAQGVWSGWQVQQAELDRLEAGRPVSVRATLRRRGPQADGDRLLLSMPLPSSRFLAMAGARPDRQVPMRLTSDVLLAWDLRLELGDLHLTELPPPVTLQSGPLVFVQELRREGTALVLRRRATMGAGTIAVAKLGDWMQLLQQVERAEDQSLGFRVE
ncbi:MAG: hypothetical protein JNM25_06025 [Planctomycetes bacterium]|nr:hypothetical protein [Planctomycetota bacterium]